MVVGFTGTREGMSARQMDQLRFILSALFSRQNVFHFGGAVGADTQAYSIARSYNYDIHWHPCPGVTRDPNEPEEFRDEVWNEVFPPLVRNKHIVQEGNLLIAAPETDREVLRSGTWATVRYARQIFKPVIMLSRGGKP